MSYVACAIQKLEILGVLSGWVQVLIAPAFIESALKNFLN
jgi:hypothetical protein